MNLHPERAQDYLEHILTALERIQRYTSEKTAEDFAAETLVQDGVMRNLSVVGEAAHRILSEAPDFAAAHREIPLAKIYATRNRIMHGYEEVDLSIVWNLVQNDVPDLRSKIETLLTTMKQKSS